MVSTAVTPEELVWLFRGDDDTTGYAHPCLVEKLCELIKPCNVEMIRRRLYGTGLREELPNDVVAEAIEQGYARWKLNAPPAGTFAPGGMVPPRAP